MAKRTKPPAPTKRELEQQGVLALRPSDQLMVVQGGVQKLLLVGALIEAVRGMAVDTLTSMAVPAHNHPESDVVNLGTDLTAIIAALAGKAPIAHAHNVGDILHNFVDATAATVPAPAVVYNGAFAATAKATVAGGNAVFQFTVDGTPSGAAIFPTGPLPNSEQFRAEEGTNPHAFGAAVWSNGNKTLTVPVSKTGAAIAVALLGLTLLGQNVVANGSVIYATAWGR